MPPRVSPAQVEAIYGLFYGRYQEETNATDYLFSDIEEIQAYVPQITHPRLTFPLIATKFEAMKDDVTGKTMMYFPFGKLKQKKI